MDLLPPARAVVWCGFVFFSLPVKCVPASRRSCDTASPRDLDRQSLRAFRLDFRVALVQFGLQVALLAHQAWLMVDAIVRTLSRLYRQRQLLEWVTAAAASSDRELGLVSFYRRLAGAVALTACAAIAVVYADHWSWLIATPLLGAWMLSPGIAWWVSRAPRPAQRMLLEADLESLRLTARRTWHFFETFVTAEDHMLPPDNFQEDPRPVLATPHLADQSRPLSSLSVLAARDLAGSALRRRRSAGRSASDNEPAGAVPRSFL